MLPASLLYRTPDPNLIIVLSVGNVVSGLRSGLLTPSPSVGTRPSRSLGVSKPLDKVYKSKFSSGGPFP